MLAFFGGGLRHGPKVARCVALRCVALRCVALRCGRATLRLEKRGVPANGSRLSSGLGPKPTANGQGPSTPFFGKNRCNSLLHGSVQGGIRGRGPLLRAARRELRRAQCFVGVARSYGVSRRELKRAQGLARITTPPPATPPARRGPSRCPPVDGSGRPRRQSAA